jgi:beta-alanine degradation protein BauB
VKSPDMVKASPKNCKVLFENDQIRLVEVRMKPGEVVPMHAHEADDIWDIKRAGKIRETVAGRKPRVLNLRPGQAWHHAGPYEHSMENIGKTEYQSLGIELKHVTQFKSRK